MPVLAWLVFLCFHNEEWDWLLVCRLEELPAEKAGMDSLKLFDRKLAKVGCLFEYLLVCFSGLADSCNDAGAFGRSTLPALTSIEVVRLQCKTNEDIALG